MRCLVKLGILMLPLFFAQIYAQEIDDKVGTAGFQFLKLGVGGRDAALGGATSAIPKGPAAMHWNPAGICLENKFNVTFFHSFWIATINHDFIGLTTPISRNDFLGVAIDFVTMDEMEETTIEAPQGTGRKFSASDYAIIGTYGRRITDRFDVAITAKYFSEQIWDLVSDGWAFDIGFVYRYSKFRIGMSFNNWGVEKEISGKQLELEQQIFTDYNTDDVLLNLVPQKIRLPISFRFGLGMEAIKSGLHKLELMGNIVYFSDIGENGNTGIEYSFMENFILRGGYQFNREGFDWSFGGGLQIYMGKVAVVIDYAAVNTRDFSLRHQTAVSFKF